MGHYISPGSNVLLENVDGGVGHPAFEAFLRHADFEPPLDGLLFFEHENAPAFGDREVGGIT